MGVGRLGLFLALFGAKLANQAVGEPQVGNFGAGTTSVNIPADLRLDVLVGPNLGQGSRNFTITLRLGGSVTIGGLSQGGVLSLDGRVWSNCAISSATTNAYWALVPLDAPPAFGSGTAGLISIASGTTIGLVANTGPVLLADSASHTTVTPYASGNSAPADGVAWFTVTGTSGNAVSLSDGTNTKIIVTDTLGHWVLVQFPVVQGTTYTLTGTGLLILGASGFIGVG